MAYQTDEELMAGLAAGQVAALEWLVDQHYGPLLGYLYRMVGGDRALAEDLVQDAFTRVIDRRGYQAARPVKPWLYAIATNLVRDHFRRAAIRWDAPDTAPPDRADADPGPEALLLRSEQGAAVALVLRQLAPEYRAALVLRFYGELSLQEIATALDIPLGTVKSRLSVGSRRLRDLLGDHYERI